jgi:hypothetical protein
LSGILLFLWRRLGTLLSFGLWCCEVWYNFIRWNDISFLKTCQILINDNDISVSCRILERNMRCSDRLIVGFVSGRFLGSRGRTASGVLRPVKFLWVIKVYVTSALSYRTDKSGYKLPLTGMVWLWAI